MHKRTREHHRSFGVKHNANVKISESDTRRLLTLVEELTDGEEDFASTYLRSEYLSKYCAEDVVPAAVRREAALQKWLATEVMNAGTNQRLAALDPGYNILPRVTLQAFLRFVRRIIHQVLGELDDTIVLGSFSGGASTSRRRTESDKARKFVGVADVTEGAAIFVDVIHREAPLLRELGCFYDLREVEGAKFFTVPKKTDIDRCACKEPDINMFLQKGVGIHIRRGLRRFGINLNDQSVNRRLARRGSLDGSLATLDLTAASDSIAIECVRILLPDLWFRYLNDIRSQKVLVGETYVQTEMFSSMGNGFTFELESLIFYALMRGVSYFSGHSGVISVYGDDLIIPSGMYEDASWVLKEFGFSLNTSKSFATGPFRESCGGHYHSGEDVTPFYLKRKPTRLTDVIRVGNQLRRWAHADSAREYSVPSTYRLWSSIAQMVPRGFWGGRDYALDTQLVTPDSPKYRLVRLTDEKELPEVGRYAAWHNDNWDRSREPEPGFPPSETKTICRRRRATTGAPTLAEEFYEELFGDAGPA